jgi:hypothetical protein
LKKEVEQEVTEESTEVAEVEIVQGDYKDTAGFQDESRSGD